MPALEHLAALVHDIRPEWDTPGIRAVLARDHRPLQRIIAAALSAAYDPSARTPGVIPNRQGDGWMARTSNNPEHPSVRELDLGRAQPAVVARRGAALARAALQRAQSVT